MDETAVTAPPSFTNACTTVDDSNQGPLYNSPTLDTLNPAPPYLPPYSVDKPNDQLGQIPLYPLAPIPPPEDTHGPISQRPRQNFQTPKQQPPTVEAIASHQTRVGFAMILAIFVLFCINLPFGLIAIVIVGFSGKVSNPDDARRLVRASIAVSIIGIIITFVAIAIGVGVGVSIAKSISTTPEPCRYSRYC